MDSEDYWILGTQGFEIVKADLLLLFRGLKLFVDYVPFCEFFVLSNILSKIFKFSILLLVIPWINLSSGILYFHSS